MKMLPSFLFVILSSVSDAGFLSSLYAVSVLLDCDSVCVDGFSAVSGSVPWTVSSIGGGFSDMVISSIISYSARKKDSGSLSVSSVSSGFISCFDELSEYAVVGISKAFKVTVTMMINITVAYIRLYLDKCLLQLLQNINNQTLFRKCLHSQFILYMK